MRDFVLLCGGYTLDTHNASAVKALGLAQMMQRFGASYRAGNDRYTSPVELDFASHSVQ